MCYLGVFAAATGLYVPAFFPRFPFENENLKKKSSTTIPHANKELADLWFSVEQIKFQNRNKTMSQYNLKE